MISGGQIQPRFHIESPCFEEVGAGRLKVIIMLHGLIDKSSQFAILEQLPPGDFYTFAWRIPGGRHGRKVCGALLAGVLKSGPTAQALNSVAARNVMTVRDVLCRILKKKLMRVEAFVLSLSKHERLPRDPLVSIPKLAHLRQAQREG